MTALLDKSILPTPDDAALAENASRHLSRAKHDGSELSVQVDGGEVLRLPKSISDLLYTMLTEMAQGNAVTLIPIHAELTTQEAADYINVSRPYLIKLLEQGKLKFHLVGTHRRVRFSDLKEFVRAAEVERQKMMEELAAQAQDLDGLLTDPDTQLS